MRVEGLLLAGRETTLMTMTIFPWHLTSDLRRRLESTRGFPGLKSELHMVVSKTKGSSFPDCVAPIEH